MLKFLLLLTVGFALAGCHKSPDELPAPTQPKPNFTGGYFFNNEDDANVATVWLQTRTFLPNKNGPGNNRLQMYDNTYSNITPNQRIAHISAEPHTEKTLYPGCLT